MDTLFCLVSFFANKSYFRGLRGLKVHFNDINHGDAEAEGHACVVDHVQKGFVVLLQRSTFLCSYH